MHYILHLHFNFGIYLFKLKLEKQAKVDFKNNFIYTFLNRFFYN